MLSVLTVKGLSHFILSLSLLIGDDVSGSGSGMCADDVCRGPRMSVPSTDRPKLYAYPPENKKVVKGSASQNLPCITIYLLSLVTLLLRR